MVKEKSLKNKRLIGNKLFLLYFLLFLIIFTKNYIKTCIKKDCNDLYSF